MIREEECKMYHLENRLKTYSGWPFTEGCVCTPENMAKAGFIHCPTENSPDVAQCFFCYKELEGWEPDDVPEQEHQRHSPACHFIALKKPVEELTLEELMKLQKERQKFLIIFVAVNMSSNVCYPLVYPFSTDTSKQPEPVRRLINMFKAVVILLPLSLVLLVFGGICGLEYGVQRFAHVHIAFGLSMAMAWLSFTMEIITGSLLLLAAKITGTQQNLEATAGYSLSMEEGP
ncbi:UNVERIFIED_CONTAM: hypothetical protein FKN15_046800 [Acipenser sinensis]